ncbi:MAG: hypothetical protein WCF30_00575 [Terracidiphilus sp.]
MNRKHIGIVLLVVGTGGLLALTFALMMVILYLVGSEAINAVPVALFFPLGVLLAAAAIFLFISPGLRRLQPSVEELMAADSRPPVVFLRSYRDEAMMQPVARQAPTASGTLFLRASRGRVEVGLVSGLNRIGPVIAIGKPGEKLPQLGAARAYVKTEDWQETIASWMARARLVVMLVHTPTPGTQWEIQHARSSRRPEQFVLYFPGTMGAREQLYSAYRDRLSQMLDRPLPPNMVISQFIRFDSDWTPQFVANTAELVGVLEPNAQPLTLRKVIGTARFSVFVALIAGLGLELIFFVYKSVELLTR